MTQTPDIHLVDQELKRFNSGYEDHFIVTAKRSLGQLTHIEIWHDSTGISPAWLVNLSLILNSGRMSGVVPCVLDCCNCYPPLCF